MADLVCPKCGSKELHPDGDKLLIRGYKVFSCGRWKSQCLVCAGYYNQDLTVKPIGKNGRDPDYDESKGWF